MRATPAAIWSTGPASGAGVRQLLGLGLLVGGHLVAQPDELVALLGERHQDPVEVGQAAFASSMS
jgi:hypothetical protein